MRKMEIPFSVKKYRLRYGSIAADLFVDRAWGALHRPLAIFLPGLPDFIGPTALTTELVRHGVTVLQPHLAGTYDSDGLFSPDGCRDTLRQTSKAISEGGLVPAGGSRPLNVEPTKISLIGHSFGGITALRWFGELQGLNSLFFTSAALHYSRQSPDYGLDEDGRASFESLAASNPHTYRVGDMEAWDPILTGIDPLPSHPLGAVSSVKLIYGASDKYFDLDAVRENAPDLVSAYVDVDRGVSLEVVPGAGHYLPEIVAARSLEALMPEALP
ncbi:alpha/beta hydrolase family protein [Streptomyces sp. NPDC088350]|uniref:alpha/beta hydrolase family protein n=1 Tax=Streptomyces sp. NPDC088350 TaxID=3365854 RepID=UPI003826DD51